jgi:succinoglycan biosynthesis protein ExoM
MVRLPHITVCICTYKRPALLRRLLVNLAVQNTDGKFTYAIVVVDNDGTESARHVVSNAGLSISYHVEPEQNIALARNRAVENAQGDFVAFIDDDEFPEAGWLLELYNAHAEFGAAGVLGPVIPYFDESPPQWVVRGRFYERPRHETGEVLNWTSTRTGNALLESRLFNERPAFRRQLGGGGEDRDFFKRKIENGERFVWCNEAIVHEVVPSHRWKRTFMLRRALHRGQGYLTNPSYDRLTIPRSLLAISLYSVVLPFLLLVGDHVFMKYLIKLFDHLGKCLAFLGITLVKDKYITE